MSSFESDDSFLGQFSFTDSFETRFMYGCNFVKPNYSSSEVILFSDTLFSSSEALLISDIISSKFVLNFLSLLDILYKKALSTIFFESNDMNDQKEINFILSNSF